MCRQVEQKTILDYILNSNIFKCASRADPNALKEQYHEICDFLNDIFEKNFSLCQSWDIEFKISMRLMQKDL